MQTVQERDPQLHVRLLLAAHPGTSAVYLDRPLYQRLLRSLALPGDGPRAPQHVTFLGAKVAPHQLISPQGRVV